jgi:hypothetical protein
MIAIAIRLSALVFSFVAWIRSLKLIASLQYVSQNTIAAGVVFPENNTPISAFLVVYRPGRSQRHLNAGLVRKTPKGPFYPKRGTTINRELSSKKLARSRHVVTYMSSVKHRGRGFIGNSSGIRSSKIIHTQKVQGFLHSVPAT